MTADPLFPRDSLFGRLRAACAEEWQAFVGHDFVERLGAGTLPESCYRHYLAQDYVFLVHFSRAYALAVYKSDSLDDMRQAAATLDALLNAEMGLHIETCAGWGLSEDDLARTPECDENLAYTRFVLERGLSGDLLDLLAALAPCVAGYAEIGHRLLADPGPPANPYRPWIQTYGGVEYQEVARAAVAQLDRVAARRLGAAPLDHPRWPSLVETFRTATRLEIGFWLMGLRPPGGVERT